MVFKGTSFIKHAIRQLF